MSEKIRTYDSNTRRKTNKQYHQLEKNILEKNYFSYVGIVSELNQGPGNFKNRWCKLTLIPTITFKEFDRNDGYAPSLREQNDTAFAFIPEGMNLGLKDVVLVIFTDVNFRNAMVDILKGYEKTNKFFEQDITKHSLNFGIVTNILMKEPII